MHSEAIYPGIRLGPYPERGADESGKLDEYARRLVGRWLLPPPLARLQAKRFLKRVAEQGEALRNASDDALREATQRLRRDLRREGLREELSAQAFALVREFADRTLKARPYDSQIIGGWAMLGGMLAEMETGEGKTLAVTLPACTAALAGIPVHVITVNDYLVTRDATLMAPLYRALGLTVGTVTQDQTEPAVRVAAYACDITYCSNKQLAFDYLRDRVTMGPRRSRLQRLLDRVCDDGSASNPSDGLLLDGLCFAIVDEADSVLLDECRTPLILSRQGRNAYEADVYRQALSLAAILRRDIDYKLHPAEKRVELCATGRERLARESAARGAFWKPTRRREDLVSQALAAIHVHVRDDAYLVRDGKVQIIDPHTGRVLPDRSWELGLHQMIETKEGVGITAERESIARITYQQFFRRYLRLAATTGTAREVAGELWSVYGLRVFQVPSHRPSLRVRLPTTIHETAEAKWQDVVERIRQVHYMQRPVLVGTRSLAASESLSERLRAAGLDHQVLNARQDAREAAIIAQAGRSGRITIATNMAGRGTDIRLFPGVAVAGGLHVIATEFNDSGRIDRQLYGRCGRQGDPGSFEAVLSMEDTLVKFFYPAPILLMWHTWLQRNGALANRGAALLFRLAQWATERSHARARRHLVERDQRMGEALAFAGPTE
jgi:preprotein translocase subunit SecA